MTAVAERTVSKNAKSMKTSQTFFEVDAVHVVSECEGCEKRHQRKYPSGKEVEVRTDTPCESWILRWREPHGIKFKGCHRESLDCCNYTEWLRDIDPVVAEYKQDDIFNATRRLYFIACSLEKSL